MPQNEVEDDEVKGEMIKAGHHLRVYLQKIWDPVKIEHEVFDW